MPSLQEILEWFKYLTEKIVGELVVGITTFVLGLVTAWAGAWLQRRRAVTKANPLWSDMLKERLIVVLGGFAGSQDREFEPSGTIGMGDARAVGVLEAWFKSIGFDNYEIHYAHEIPGEVLRDNNLAGC